MPHPINHLIGSESRSQVRGQVNKKTTTGMGKPTMTIWACSRTTNNHTNQVSGTDGSTLYSGINEFHNRRVIHTQRDDLGLNN